MKEATAARHYTKVEGGLDLVKDAKFALKALSARVDVAKLKVDYLEALIRYRGQIPEK